SSSTLRLERIAIGTYPVHARRRAAGREVQLGCGQFTTSPGAFNLSLELVTGRAQGLQRALETFVAIALRDDVIGDLGRRDHVEAGAQTTNSAILQLCSACLPGCRVVGPRRLVAPSCR